MRKKQKAFKIKKIRNMSCSVSDDHSADHYFCATASDGTSGRQGYPTPGTAAAGKFLRRMKAVLI